MNKQTNTANLNSLLEKIRGSVANKTQMEALFGDKGEGKELIDSIWKWGTDNQLNSFITEKEGSIRDFIRYFLTSKSNTNFFKVIKLVRVKEERAQMSVGKLAQIVDYLFGGEGWDPTKGGECVEGKNYENGDFSVLALSAVKYVLNKKGRSETEKVLIDQEFLINISNGCLGARTLLDLISTKNERDLNIFLKEGLAGCVESLGSSLAYVNNLGRSKFSSKKGESAHLNELKDAAESFKTLCEGIGGSIGKVLGDMAMNSMGGLYKFVRAELALRITTQAAGNTIFVDRRAELNGKMTPEILLEFLLKTGNDKHDLTKFDDEEGLKKAIGRVNEQIKNLFNYDGDDAEMKMKRDWFRKIYVKGNGENFETREIEEGLGDITYQVYQQLKENEEQRLNTFDY